MSFPRVRPRARVDAASCTCTTSYGLFIDGEFVDGHGQPFSTISPATEKKIATIATRERRPTSTRPSPPRAAPTTRPGRRCAARDRGKYLFRIARLVQERARELAVAESLDNGKPIKESRDVDVPLVAAWFFYYAGWADKLDYAGPRRRTRARSASPRRSSRGTSRC